MGLRKKIRASLLNKESRKLFDKICLHGFVVYKHLESPADREVLRHLLPGTTNTLVLSYIVSFGCDEGTVFATRRFFKTHRLLSKSLQDAKKEKAKKEKNEA